MRDLAIIGGGPAGLYSAYKLAAAGLDIVVLEEHPSAGEPVHCTGVLAAEAFDEFDIPRDVILNSLRTARFFGPTGASVDYTTKSVEAVAIDRRTLDSRLSEQALRAGAHIEVGVRATDVQVEPGKVVVSRADGSSSEARACILACGANYGIQRRLGFGMPSAYLQSAQLELPASSTGQVEVHFGHDVAPKGFGWVVPVQRDAQSYVRIGLMCEREPREYFARFLARVAPRWLTESQASADSAPVPRTKLLPLGPLERTFTSRVLAVGDAAGLVKATTGGGIYYSLLSASLAADILIDAFKKGDLGADRLEEYERQWRAQLGAELEAQMTLRNIANEMSDEDIDSLFELARTDGVMPIVRRTATFNRHRALILSLLNHPPARRVLMRRVLDWGRSA